MFNKCCNQKPCTCSVVYEPPIQNCIQNDYVHEIKHIVPINTNIINNQIYKHTYLPEYTCQEETIVTNLNSCNN